jgi:hypothetical protein
MAFTTSGSFIGKDVAVAHYAPIPFGPEYWEQSGMRHGGERLRKNPHAKHNIQAIACGLAPLDASGWSREEVKMLEDLKGLGMRIFGHGANVMRRLGVVPRNVMKAFHKKTRSTDAMSDGVARLGATQARAAVAAAPASASRPACRNIIRGAATPRSTNGGTR